MKCKLSICIPTLNRGSFIRETIESIVSQLEDDVEVVIVDGGSIDDTEQIVNAYQLKYPAIKYLKKESSKSTPSNEGFDRDCNNAVELSQGEYCWLMTDDDLLMPGAIKRVLNEIGKGFALIVASIEIRNKDLTKVLIKKRPEIVQDQIYYASDWDQFLIKMLSHLTFVGTVIIKRQLWLSRNRERYFGSGFIHIGVILDERINENILVISSSLISLRYGNALWSNRAFQVWMFNWPELIWSFSTISDQTKKLSIAKEPWRQPIELLMLRALGSYSRKEYQLYLSSKDYSKSQRILAKLIAYLPRKILLITLYAYLNVRGVNCELALYDLRNSICNVK